MCFIHSIAFCEYFRYTPVFLLTVCPLIVQLTDLQCIPCDFPYDFIGNSKEAVYLIVIIFSDKPVEKTLPPSLTIFQYGSLCDMGIDAGNR